MTARRDTSLGWHTGTIDAPTPLRGPLSGKPACLMRLEADYYSVTHQRSRSDLSDLRYAPNATFTVNGRRLSMVGRDGEPVDFLPGDSWRPRAGEHVPPELWGWGTMIDTLLRCTEPDSTCRLRNVRVRERLIACGAELTLRGEVQGDQFVLYPR